MLEEVDGEGDRARGPARLRRFFLLDGFEYGDGALGLQGRRHPEVGVIHVGHVDPEAAVLTKQDQGSALKE